MSKLIGSLFVLALGSGWSSAAAEAVQDAVIVDPDAHQVMLENDHVRLIRAIASPGHKSAMHSHPALAVISLGTARVRVTYPDGKQQILDLHPGMAFWSDGIEHSWELLAGEVNVIAVEVKAAKQPPTE
jgi:hypothetical protein